MKRSILAIAATLGLAASLVGSPTHAQPNLPDSVIECVARELGTEAAQQIQTQRANAEQEAVIRQCFQASGSGGGGSSTGPSSNGPAPQSRIPSSKCVSSKGLKRYVKKLSSPNRLGVNIGQYPHNPGAFYYSPTTLAQDGYKAVRYTMQMYYDGSTGRLLHGKGDGMLSLSVNKWLCSHSDEIREAKRAGLAVALFVELLNYSSVQASQNGGGPPNFDHPDGIENRLSKEYLAVVPQIARFAERYKVDWFDPANEADKGFTAANAARMVKSTPKRTKAFKGLLVTQPLVTTYEAAGIVPDMSGYDLVSLHDGDILREAQNYEQTGQLSDRLFAQSETAWQWAQASGVKRYLVGEFGQFDAVDPAPSVDATRAVVDAYLERFPNPQGLFCQDNPDPSMDRFENSPMNAVCKALQARFR
jgi:hypothetical protein